ncbi:lytic transglycosylase domain-containing protein [Thiomicrorhabdus aquaedulcis]|uniref:lytic transglycosylase domain-containing protein n=1 Tax=Thiomicrorhabdus aquaedulcis TaxID=2211106 RepID=UPI000FDC45CA|nr:lytic transglycosylase domain-containing protein [Thiomicrorhabdus aquaedulcis]
MKRILFTLLVLTSFNSHAKNAELLVEQCLPPAYWTVMKSIVKVESSGKLYALGVNEAGYKSHYPQTVNEARYTIRSLLEKGLSFGIGLAQIDTQHFKPGKLFWKRGFTEEDALDPCTNLKMGAMIFSDNYRRYGNVADALSAYNTGSPTRGYKNGYLARFN